MSAANSKCGAYQKSDHTLAANKFKCIYSNSQYTNYEKIKTSSSGICQTIYYNGSNHIIDCNQRYAVNGVIL